MNFITWSSISSRTNDYVISIPGHAVEAGWFLLQYARKNNNEELRKTAIQDFIIRMFDYGWDPKYGGLFYYLDVDGYR